MRRSLNCSIPQPVSMVAVEIDRDLIAMLRARFTELEVVNADILKLDLRSLLADGLAPGGQSALQHIVAAAGQTLWPSGGSPRHALHVSAGTLERLAAEPGTKDWGRLSVLTQYFCNVQPLFDVPPEAFSPPPRVHSQVIRLWPRDDETCVDRTALALTCSERLSRAPQAAEQCAKIASSWTGRCAGSAKGRIDRSGSASGSTQRERLLC